ncbi:YkgJ family cysteine cluster protein [Candidatus Woesearchaeota archaeon]|nr:YkgJ family cysteine cluster protein [Candidatus Woesearchaeota archaeon]
MDAEKIADKARKSIGRYCAEECKAYCCRKGYLVMTADEAELVTQGRLAELMENGVIVITPTGRYSMNMGLLENGCPSLKDYKCTIHMKRGRPDTCKKFPLFIEGSSIKVSQRCPAAKEGLLYPYIAKLVRMGYRLEEGNSYSDSEIYKILPDLKKPEDNVCEIHA